MREWILYNHTVGQVINNASFNAENVRVEFSYKDSKGVPFTKRVWLPVAECTPITKEVADIIISNEK